MLSLIKVDFLRILKNKLFLVGAIIAGAFSVLFPLLYFGISKTDKSMEMYAATPTYQMLSVMPVGFILSLFLSIIVGQEYSFGTIRNKIIIGKKRSHIYFSLFFTTTVVYMTMIIAATALTAAVGFIFLHKFFPPNYNIAKFFMNIGFCFLSFLAMSSLITLFSAGLNKVALSIILIGAGSTFLGSIVPLILAGIAPNSESVRIIFKVLLSCDYFYTTGLYLTLVTSGSVFGGGIGDFIEELIKLNTIQIIVTVLAPIGFFFLNYFLGDLAFRKKNIK